TRSARVTDGRPRRMIGGRHRMVGGERRGLEQLDGAAGRARLHDRPRGDPARGRRRVRPRLRLHVPPVPGAAGRARTAAGARVPDRAGDRAGPTLFRRVPYSDRLLRGMCVVGVLLGVLTVLGVPQQGPAWAMIAVFGVMWVLYLSIHSVGQVFYGYGWESMLLECGALVGLLGSHAVAPPLLMILFLRWMLLRLEFGAGMIKMRGDASWRDLTAM